MLGYIYGGIIYFDKGIILEILILYLILDYPTLIIINSILSNNIVGGKLIW